MRATILSLACALVWTTSASCQEFKAVLSSDDFRPGKEITLTIHGGKAPFTFGFGSGFFRGEKLLLKVTSPDERTYRLTVTEDLNTDPVHVKFRTITVEDDTGRETIARMEPTSQPPSRPGDDVLAKLIANLQSPDEAVRLQAAKKLGNMGPAARPALAALQRLVNDPDEDVRLVAAAAIRRIEAIGQPPTTSDQVKALIQQLQSPEEFDRLFALRALAKLGAAAKDAIPFVERLANEGTALERDLAQTVLDTLRRAAPIGVDSGDAFSTTTELTTADEKDAARQGSHRKVFPRRLVGGSLYLIDMVSDKFDTYLRLEDDQGTELAKDDDSGGNLNARITFTAPRDGVYRIIATSFTTEATGKFTLTVLPVRVVLNIAEQLTADDAKDTVRTDSVRKVHPLQMNAGKQYIVDLRSDDFDSYLRLEDDQGNEVARDDDSGGFPHARITFTAPRDGIYRIIATTYAKAAFGRFTLRVYEGTSATIAPQPQHATPQAKATLPEEAGRHFDNGKKKWSLIFHGSSRCVIRKKVS